MSVPPLNPFWSDATMSNGTVLPAPPPPDPTTITPTVGNVAALCATRTIDTSGEQLGAFTSDTRPTDVEVQALIDQATDETLTQFPPKIDVLWWPALTRLIALRAAALVELSYYREQTLAGASTTALGQYAAELQALIRLIPIASYLG